MGVGAHVSCTLATVKMSLAKAPKRGAFPRRQPACRQTNSWPVGFCHQQVSTNKCGKKCAHSVGQPRTPSNTATMLTKRVPQSGAANLARERGCPRTTESGSQQALLARHSTSKEYSREAWPGGPGRARSCPSERLFFHGPLQT